MNVALPRLACLCAIAILFFQRQAPAQTQVQLQGIVFDPDAQTPIEDIQVDVYQVQKKITTSVQTKKDGTYTLANLPPSARLHIDFYDPRSGAHGRNRYEWLPIRNVYGDRPLHVINVWLSADDRAQTSIGQARERVERYAFAWNRLQRTKGVDVEETRRWVTAYLAQALTIPRRDPDARFGPEVAALVDSLKPATQELMMAERTWVRKNKSRWSYGEVVRDDSAPQSMGKGKPLSLNHYLLKPSFCVPLSEQYVFSGGKYGRLDVLNLSDRPNDVADQVTSRLKIDPQLGSVHSLATNSADRFAIGGVDGTARLCSLRTPSDVRALTVGPSPVAASAFSPSGSLFASATIDGTLGIWKLPGGELVRRIMLPKRFPNSMTFSSDSKRIVIGTGLSDVDTAILSVSAGETPETSVVDVATPISMVDFVNDKTLLTFSDLAHEAAAWQVTESGSLLKFRQITRLTNIEDISFHPDKAGVGIIPSQGDYQLIYSPTANLFHANSLFEKYGIAVEKMEIKE